MFFQTVGALVALVIAGWFLTRWTGLGGKREPLSQVKVIADVLAAGFVGAVAGFVILLAVRFAIAGLVCGDCEDLWVVLALASVGIGGGTGVALIWVRSGGLTGSQSD